MSRLELKRKIEFLKILQNNKSVGSVIKYLDDESLFILSEFLYNIVYNTLNLSKREIKKIQKYLSPYEKPILKILKTKDNKTRKQAYGKLSPQFGGALGSILAAGLPLLISLLSKR